MLSSLHRSLPAIAGTSAFWIVVLVAVLLFGLRRPPPQPIQIVPPAEVTAPAPAAGAAPAATATPGQVRVYVSGAVIQPGVYRLSPDSLVEDAVNAAGGAAAEADLVAINLAQSLADGEQIYVPRTGEVTPPTPGVQRASPLAPGGDEGTSAEPNASAPIDLNLATEAQLEALPGIGPKTAAAIIDGRPYGAVDDLLRVKGIGDATLAKLRPFVKVE